MGLLCKSRQSSDQDKMLTVKSTDRKTCLYSLDLKNPINRTVQWRVAFQLISGRVPGSNPTVMTTEIWDSA